MGRKAEDRNNRNGSVNLPDFTEADRFGQLTPIAPEKNKYFRYPVFTALVATPISLTRKTVTRISGYYQICVAIILQMMSEEREAGSGLTVAPLFFGIGICVYFLGASEPLLWPSLITSVILIAFSVRMKNHGLVWMAICVVALFITGMSVAKIRTDTKNTRTLTQNITAHISGTIIEVTRNSRGAPRYLIAVNKIEKLNAAQTPKLVRLSAQSKHIAGVPGNVIYGLGRMQPVTGPVYPGGYDFSFNHWFRGLGGTGFFMGRPDIGTNETDASNITIFQRYEIFINGLRGDIAKRIYASMDDEKADIAVALIIGDRSGISRATTNSLRNSGLAHVLAISGMHMALVSLTFIWAVRFLLSLNLRLVQSAAIKNWAALAGFFVASTYLTISGLGVATQRAWIMISVVLLATLVNRKALTLRSVSIAAMFVLIFQPESILSPGFQMSFAAVAAIIAAWEWRDKHKTTHVQAGVFSRLLRFLATLAFTSLIAGTATSIIAAWHFQQFAVFGVVTNLLAMPIVSLCVMPLALLSMLLMPYGLEHYALVLMGYGIEGVVAISAQVNEFGDVQTTGILAMTILPLSCMGLFILTMFKTKLRLLALIPFGFIPFEWGQSEPPDLLLSEDGRAIALKTTVGMKLLYPRRNRFVTDIWKKSWPDSWPVEKVKNKNKKQKPKYRCDKDICIKPINTNSRLYVVYDPKLLRDACNNADILLAPRLRWVNCRGKLKPSLIVKRGDLEEYDSHAIYFAKNSFEKHPKEQTENLTNIAALQLTKPIKLNAKHANTRIKILKVDTAYDQSSRPWNARRRGRAKYLQDTLYKIESPKTFRNEIKIQK